MSGETDKTVLGALRHLIHHGPLSRPELGTALGLSRATTSPIINDLMRRGLVSELSTTPQGQRGRPVALLDLDDERYAVTGLEIGSDRVLAGVYSLRGRQLLRIERSATPDAVNPRGLLRHAAAVLHEALDVLDQEGRELLGVGVSVAGLVDATSGTIKYAPTLGWRDVALQAGVAEALGGRAPVLLDNDANLAALAELRRRRRDGLPTTSLVYLTGTYGISAGIIAGGQLWRGERGLAGEVGHLIVEAEGRKCVCGRRGCLDTRAGLSAIIATCLENASTPRRAGRTPIGISAGVEEIASRAQSGDAGVLEALADAGAWLGRGAALVCAMLDPRTVILGGHYARLAPWLLAPARESFRRALLMPAPEYEQLEVSGLDAWAAAEGSALAALLALADGISPLP
ncbi:ROK family transcriptional regulator [Actinospica durhamensis]|uniref:ROK family transcriptional regulator n=1 Tax=Actinospica durhamensis TaxID=1508375 RepID=A0A941ILU1_9ACTN|nr:ROK family transcriptional regulator [Actinospica durhamensis]MBR7832124.1 ROK family transcriptional regulator [Actinospica durhamensis]